MMRQALAITAFAALWLFAPAIIAVGIFVFGSCAFLVETGVLVTPAPDE